MKFKYLLPLIIILIVNYHSNVLSWICFESNLVWIPLAIGFVILSMLHYGWFGLPFTTKKDEDEDIK